MNDSVMNKFKKQAWHLRKRMGESMLPAGVAVVSPDVARRWQLGDPTTQRQNVATIRSEANRLWDAGKRIQAIEVLRAGIMSDPTGSLWWPLFCRLQAKGRYDAASLALRNAVIAEPHRLEALEQLVEDVAHRGGEGVVSRAFDDLTGVLPARTDIHRDALFLVLPAQHKACLATLRHSDDSVVRQVLHMFDHRDDAQVFAVAPDGSNALAVAIAATCLGKNKVARAALAALDDADLPFFGLRVTVSRLLRVQKKESALSYLKVMQRHSPTDTWVRQKLQETDDTILSPYQLTRKGFPFERRRKRAYEPDMTKSLYLLHNSLPYHSAGYATRTHGLLSAVRDLGWDVQGVTRLGYPYDMPKFTEHGDIDALDYVDGVPYHRLSTVNRLEMKKPLQQYVRRYTEALKQLAMDERPFVIHGASNHWNGLTAVNTARSLGIESIYEVRGLWEVTRGSRDPEWAEGGMFRFMARMEADAAAKATRVITITNALAEELVRRGVDESKITIVPNGVNADRFEPRERDEELAAKLGLTGKTVIGYIGSVLDYEGLGLLIDAAAVLKSQGREFAVLIVGDGAELERFQGEVADRELEDVVIFTGRVPHEEVEAYYSLVDIAPFPRLPLPVCEMVSPLKPFEAMAMQKAVVASNVAALAEIVRDGETGLLHEKGNADDLVEKLRTLLDDEPLRRRLAAQGRQWVLDERQWQSLGQRVSAIYTGIAETYRPA